MSATSVPGSAHDRRRAAGAAVLAHHPRWHGIRHPELLVLPPRRFSRLDMLPAVERGPVRFPEARAERAREIVAAHPRWKGIRHPERIFFGPLPTAETAVLSYRAALRVALAHVRDSEALSSQIDAVADRIDRRSWPWAASPKLLPPAPPRPPARSRPKLPSLGRFAGRPTPKRPVRPTARLLPH